jgi:uncharacterized membrane protein
MGKGDPKVLYIAAYDDEGAAKEDYEALKELVKEGAVFIDVAVLASRDDEGKLHVKENAHEVAGGTMLGGAAGLLIGLIFPPGVIAAAVVGGAVGGGAGKLLRHHRGTEIEKDIDDTLPNNSSGIITVFDITIKDKVDKALKDAKKVDEEEVDPESVEKVKEAAAKA